MLAQIDAFARLTGGGSGYTPVLFAVSSFALFAPPVSLCTYWANCRTGSARRRVLLLTVAGVAFSYLLWVVSGSFWLFVLSRLVGGAMSGNLSVANRPPSLM